jgi:DNA repair protein RadD
MASLDKIISRADVEALEAFIGKPAVKLLALVDQELIRSVPLRDVLFELKDQWSVATDPDSWPLLVDLMTHDEASELLTACGITPSSDPWASLRSLRIGKNLNIQTAIGLFLGVSQPAVEQKAEIPSIVPITPVYGLFAHQDLAADKVYDKLSDRLQRVVLHMPTGAGKTRTAMHVISKYLNNHAGSTALWLAYSEELCEQAAEEFQKCWHHLGRRSTELTRFWGSFEADLTALSGGLVVAGLGKTYKRIIDDLQFGAQLGNRVGLIVIDEAHQAVAPTYALLLDALQAAGTESAILGLTATPGRTWNDLDEDRKLAQFFDNQKVTLEVEGYTNPIDYLIDEGYLAKPTYRTLAYGGNTGLSESDLDRIESELDIPKQILESLALDEQRNLRIVVEAEALATRHTRILVFCPTVENAELVATTIQAHGRCAARAVSGKTPTYDRENHIRWFREESDDARILCNFGVLTTGFDAPKTSAVLIARPTKSLVLFSQMVGRGTRGPKAGGNHEAEIVTVVDTSLPGFRSLAESFTNWEDAGWNSI